MLRGKDMKKINEREMREERKNIKLVFKEKLE